jgi:hypothetical protein
LEGSRKKFDDIDTGEKMNRISDEKMEKPQDRNKQQSLILVRMKDFGYVFAIFKSSII